MATSWLKPALKPWASASFLLHSLGFPIAALFFAVAFRFGLALDRVTAQLAGVLGREFIAVEFTSDAEGNVAVFVRRIGDGDFGVVAARHRAGQFVALEFQLQ